MYYFAGARPEGHRQTQRQAGRHRSVEGFGKAEEAGDRSAAAITSRQEVILSYKHCTDKHGDLIRIHTHTKQHITPTKSRSVQISTSLHSI